MDAAAGRTGDINFHLNYVRRAATDMHSENIRLRAENERLEKLVSEIVPELKILRDERIALKAAIWALLRQSGAMPPLPNDSKLKTFTTLPSEIIQLIFNFATGESTLQFDPSIQPGAHNPWFQLIRTKKALPLISRTTYWLGMSVLYRDIVFRRMGQVLALAETLRTTDTEPQLASLIKSIRWDSCVVAAACADSVREDLGFIFSQCTQLQSFSYHPHRNFPLKSKTPDHDKWDGFFSPLWFFWMLPPLSDPPLLHSSALSNLRLLDMPVNFRGKPAFKLLRAVHQILPTFKALESLVLGRWPLPQSAIPEELMEVHTISLPSLNDLRIFAPEGAVETYICCRWNAPRLTRLTVLLSSSWSPTRLLETFGRRLRYLHLYPTRTNISDPLAYALALKECSALSTVCPRLEHLIIPRLLDTASYPLLVNSPTLIHLDLWASITDPASSHRQDRHQAALNIELSVSLDSTVPLLRTVRLIFTRDEDPRDGPWREYHSHTRHPDWPCICHPRLLPTDSDTVLYHRFAQGRVAQTVAALIPQDLGEFTWRGNEFAYGWPVVYDEEVERLLKRMDDEYKVSLRRDKKREELGLETSVSDWSSNSGELAEGDDVNILDDIDATGGRNRFKAFRSEYVSLWGFPWDQPEEGDGDEEEDENDGDEDEEDEDEDESDEHDSDNSEDGEDDEDDEDEDGEDQDGEENEGQEGGEAEEVENRENGEVVEGEEEQDEHEMKELTPKQLEAAAELISPEHPVVQLDRDTVLSAFRRGRDRESYNHVNVWDHY